MTITFHRGHSINSLSPTPAAVILTSSHSFNNLLCNGCKLLTEPMLDFQLHHEEYNVMYIPKIRL